MPQTTYTNADLLRFMQNAAPDAPVAPRRSVPRAVEPPAPEDPSVEELLAGAHATLDHVNGPAGAPARVSRLAARYRARREQETTLAAAQADTARYNDEVPNVTDSMWDRFKKNATHYVKTRPEVIGEVAPWASLLGGPVGAMASGVVAGQSAHDLVDDVPDSPLETGLNVLGLVGGGSIALRGGLNGLRSVVNARKAAQGAKQSGDLVRGVVDYAGERAGALEGTGLSRKAAMKQASTEAGWPLGRSTATTVRHPTQIVETAAERDALEDAMVRAGFNPEVAGRVSGAQADRAGETLRRTRRSRILEGLKSASDSATAPKLPYQGLERRASPRAEDLLNDLLRTSPDDASLRALKQRLQGNDPYDTILGAGGRR